MHDTADKEEKQDSGRVKVSAAQSWPVTKDHGKSAKRQSLQVLRDREWAGQARVLINSLS